MVGIDLSSQEIPRSRGPYNNPAGPFILQFNLMSSNCVCALVQNRWCSWSLSLRAAIPAPQIANWSLNSCMEEEQKHKTAKPSLFFLYGSWWYLSSLPNQLVATPLERPNPILWTMDRPNIAHTVIFFVDWVSRSWRCDQTHHTCAPILVCRYLKQVVASLSEVKRLLWRKLLAFFLFIICGYL